jgi:hypothetical protein
MEQLTVEKYPAGILHEVKTRKGAEMLLLDYYLYQKKYGNQCLLF